jgi:hypothetical protein
MATQGTKKVGGVAAAKNAGGAVAAAAAKKDKPAKVKRGLFDVKTAVDAGGKAIELNEDGQLTAVPSNWDPKLHKPLKGKQFADDGVLNDYKAQLADLKAAHFKLLADNFRKDAEQFRKFGDPEKRKGLKKVEKLAEQYLALQEGQEDGEGLPSLEELLEMVKQKRAAKAAAAATPAA